MARDLIQATTLLVEDREDKGVEHSGRRSFGYSGLHLSVRPVDVGVDPPEHACGALERIEIQLRTQTQHAWAEVEHELRYKGATIEDAESRELHRIAALLETADGMLSRLVDAAAAREPAEGDGDGAKAAAQPPATPSLPRPPATLPELLERRFPGAQSPTTRSLSWIAHCAAVLDLDDLAQIDAVLGEVPFEQLEEVFRKVGHSPRSQVRLLDDALLWLGQDRYLQAAEDGVEGTSDRYRRGRPGILRWRLDRLREAGPLDA